MVFNAIGDYAKHQQFDRIELTMLSIAVARLPGKSRIFVKAQLTGNHLVGVALGE